MADSEMLSDPEIATLFKLIKGGQINKSSLLKEILSTAEDSTAEDTAAEETSGEINGEIPSKRLRSEEITLSNSPEKKRKLVERVNISEGCDSNSSGSSGTELDGSHSNDSVVNKSLDISDVSTENQSEKSKPSNSTQENIRQSTCKSSKLTVTVRDVLVKYASIGSVLHREYNKNRILSRSSKKRLVGIIAVELIVDEFTIVRNSEFKRLAEEICSIFPNEKVNTYYVPPVPKQISRNKKSKVSLGMLVNRIHNEIKKYRKSVGYRKKNVQKPSPPVISSNAVRNSLAWLKHNQEPISEVKLNWEITSDHRLQELASCDLSIDDYIKKWPIIRSTWGHILFDIDFKRAHGISEDSLLTGWAEFFNALEARKSARKVEAAFHYYKILDDENSSEDAKTLAQFLLLPFMIPPQGRTLYKENSKIKHWKHTSLDAQEAIIIHAQSSAYIESKQDERLEKLDKYNLHVQPYIIAVGPSLSTITKYYLIINDITYEFKTILKAFDVYFKSFHILHSKYSPECQHLLYLIQRAIYGFETEWDEKCSYVMDYIDILQE